MSDYEVSDRFWERAEPLLGPFKRQRTGGSKPLDFRRVMNGMLYVLKSGCQWSLLPPCYGSKSAVHEHFQRWVAGGAFTALFRLGAGKYEELCGFEWAWPSMDGGLVQAPVRQVRRQAAEGLGRNPTDRDLLVDRNGLPGGVVLVGADVHDSRLVTPTVQAGVIKPPATAAGLRHLCLDKGYDFERVESWRSSAWATRPTSAGSARRGMPPPGKPIPPGAGWSSGPSRGSRASGPSEPATPAGDATA
jgi:transposase